jgi:hypothetical protein
VGKNCMYSWCIQFNVSFPVIHILYSIYSCVHVGGSSTSGSSSSRKEQETMDFSAVPPARIILGTVQCVHSINVLLGNPNHSSRGTGWYAYYTTGGLC